MDRNLIDYLPTILREVREFKLIAESEQPEIIKLWSAIDDVLKDQFITDATENGIKRRESILSIVPMATDSLDVRKFRILTKINEKLPYTYRVLQQRLATLCGENGFDLNLDNANRTLNIKVSLGQKKMMDDVDTMVRKISPADLDITVELKYNRHKDLALYTHAQLSSKTHRELKEEVLY